MTFLDGSEHEGRVPLRRIFKTKTGVKKYRSQRPAVAAVVPVIPASRHLRIGKDITLSFSPAGDEKDDAEKEIEKEMEVETGEDEEPLWSVDDSSLEDDKETDIPSGDENYVGGSDADNVGHDPADAPTTEEDVGVIRIRDDESNNGRSAHHVTRRALPPVVLFVLAILISSLYMRRKHGREKKAELDRTFEEESSFDENHSDAGKAETEGVMA